MAIREKQKQAMKCTRLHNSCSSGMICDESIKEGQRLCQSEHHVVQRCTAVCGHNRCHFLTVHFPSLAEPFHSVVDCASPPQNSSYRRFCAIWSCNAKPVLAFHGFSLSWIIGIYTSCSWDKSVKHGCISVYLLLTTI